MPVLVLDLFRDGEGVVYFDPELANRALHLDRQHASRTPPSTRLLRRLASGFPGYSNLHGGAVRGEIAL